MTSGGKGSNLSKYRIYKPEFKAEVILESLRGQKTDAQIYCEHEIAPDRLSRWRAQCLVLGENP